MKKLFMSLLLVIMGFSLAGCGDKKSEPSDKLLNDILQDNVQQDNVQQEQGENNPVNGYEITSTDNKLVFADASGINYSVFYFENDKVVKYEVVVKYPSEQLAEIAYQASKSESPDVTVSKNGVYLIITQNIDSYVSSTKAELEDTFRMAGYKINK